MTARSSFIFLYKPPSFIMTTTAQAKQSEWFGKPLLVLCFKVSILFHALILIPNYNLLYFCFHPDPLTFIFSFAFPRIFSLWLCHNELQNIEDMSSIAKSINLKEITIENNPISLAGDCVSFLVSYLPLLNSLNQLQITEQVRRAANAWRRR